MASKTNKPIAFRFIDVGDAGPELKRKNESLARSHVMSAFRQAQREERERKKQESHKRGKSEIRICAKDVSAIATISEYSQSIDELLPPSAGLSDPAVFWSLCMKGNIATMPVSRGAFIEADINVLNGYSGPVSSHLPELIDIVIRFKWGKFWPGKVAGEASPLAREWWPLFSNIPSVFHACVFAAAVHYDDLHRTTAMSQSREILAHKYEALRQLNKALTALNGTPPRDALILAITMLGIGSDEFDRQAPMIEESNSPFRPPDAVNSPQWTRHFAYPKDNVHIGAARRLIDMKGGLEGRCLILAKSNFINDLQLAAVQLRKPHFPVWEIPDIERDVTNTSLNVLSSNIKHTQRSGFGSLLHLGLPDELYTLLLDVSNLSNRIEAYSNNTLCKPNLQALLSKKNSLHHALLSLPTADELYIPESKRGIYECCRIGALLYSSAVLYPLPPSTGTLYRLAAQVKVAVESVKLETCFEGGGKMLIWVLMLGGIASESTLERPWFLRRLKMVLGMERIGTWVSLRELVKGFLWMGCACDDSALKAWEELERPPFL